MTTRPEIALRRGRVGLGWRVTAAFAVAIVTTSAVVATALYRQQLERLEADLERQGQQLAQLLDEEALQALSGASSRFEQMCSKLMANEQLVFAGLRLADGSYAWSQRQSVLPPPPGPTYGIRRVDGDSVHPPYLLVSRPLISAHAGGGGKRLGTLELGLSLEPVAAATGALQRVTAVSVIAAVLPGLVLLTLVVMRIMRPLRDLHLATQRVAGGDLSRDVPLPRSPELAPLAHSFNLMLEQVRRHQAELGDTARNLEAMVDVRTRELRRSERKYRSLLEQAGVGILIWHPESLRIVEANAMAGEVLAATPEQLVNRKMDELFIESDRETVVTTLQLVPYQGAVHLDNVEVQHPEKGSTPVAIGASPVKFGKEMLVLGMLRDLTQAKELDRREALLNEKIQRSEHMASIGQLAAGIAHEINNPMSYVASNVNRLADDAKRLASLTAQRLQPDDGTPRIGEINEIVAELQEIANDTCEGVSRVSEIIMALREFSHGGRTLAGYEWTDLNRVIRNCLTLTKNQLEKRAEVHLDLQPLPRVRCHPTQIGQVLMNLLVNAAQAMDTRGTILISSVASGDRVHIAVEDNGKGIPEGELPKIFDPFFTTKGVGQGTGLGLSVSQQLIAQHGGAIWVDSHVEHGTRFLIELLRTGPPEVEDEEDGGTGPPKDDPRAW